MGHMTMYEMTKALLVYIKTFNIHGANMTYVTADGILKCVMAIPPDQFAVDEFATQLELLDAMPGCQASMPVVRLVDGTGCMIKEMHPVDGGDMLRKLKVLIPAKVGGKSEAMLVEVLDLLHKIFKAVTH